MKTNEQKKTRYYKVQNQASTIQNTSDQARSPHLKSVSQHTKQSADNSNNASVGSELSTSTSERNTSARSAVGAVEASTVSTAGVGRRGRGGVQLDGAVRRRNVDGDDVVGHGSVDRRSRGGHRHVGGRGASRGLGRRRDEG